MFRDVVAGTESCVVQLVNESGQSPTLTPSERRALTTLRTHFSADSANHSAWLNAASVANRGFDRVIKRRVGLGYVHKEGGRIGYYVWTGKEPIDEACDR